MNAGSQRGQDRRQQQRRQLAQEAARLMREGGHRDYDLARRKAAQRLGIRDPAAQPRNPDIDEALGELLRLFSAPDPSALRHLRESALAAMQAFSEFAPRLVGPVLDGSAEAGAAIQLHLHSDDAEAVARRLEDLAIPARSRMRRVRLDREREWPAPAWEFIAGDLPVQLLVLPSGALRQAPLDGRDGPPLARASAEALRRLLDEAGP